MNQSEVKVEVLSIVDFRYYFGKFVIEREEEMKVRKRRVISRKAIEESRFGEYS